MLRSTASGTSAQPRRRDATAPAAASARRPQRRNAALPRNSLVRIPDGTATNGIAGTVNTSHLTTASATLLRRRTAVEEDPYAQLGLRAGAFLVLPAVEVTGGYDTNPARTPGGRGSDAAHDFARS